MMVEWLFLAVPWGCLHFVIVVFPDHTHLLFLKSIFAGVPQGSAIVTLLFLIYINDIASRLLCLTRLFTDDSSLFNAAAHMSDIAGIINNHLQLLTNWARHWLVTFNPLKTEAFLFTLKN